ncbi:MAG: UbiX family flavin prenyltransferase [Campylobacterales bacterium]|nr:UbiX family flavin prenyltransferase [Campylobacterales bacterium]
MKILIAISGGSGVELGLKAYENLPENVEKHLVVSDNAKVVASKESGKNIFKNSEFWEKPASGSYGMDAMLIAPCSMNTLAKIACGIQDNLITRSAAVMIKEKKKLVIAPREMPFDSIALENMLKLSNLGVVIAPPVLAYYSDNNNLDDMENFLVGKWFDFLGIENTLFKRWNG